MNLYIGNSINDINKQDYNVEVSDELIDFIYKLHTQVSYDLSKLYSIDPYEDVAVANNDLPRIIEICNYILNESLLHDYKNPEEGYQMLRNLAEISQMAVIKGLGLFSVGD